MDEKEKDEQLNQEEETEEVSETPEDGEEFEGEEPPAEDNPYNLKEGFGRKEYEKTIGDRDYYKKEAEELKARQERTRTERANRAKNGRKDDDEESTPSSSPNSDGLTKEERDSQKESATPSEQDKKSLKEKVKDAKEDIAAKKAVSQNKINEFKAKAYKARHPVEAAKAEAKQKIKKRARAFIISHWWIFLIAFVVLLLIIIILLIALGASDDSGDAGFGYLDPKYDYTQVLVTLTNSYTNEADKVELDRKVTMEELTLGAVYYETRNIGEGYSDEQLLELYKSYAVLLKTEALALGNYTNETMEITLRSGTDIPYCDPYNGCVIKENKGIKTYISQKLQDTIPGTVKSKIDPMDEHKLELLERAYMATEYEILVPDDVKEAITKYDYANPVYNSEMKNEINTKAKKNTKYEKILEKTYKGYQVYDIRDYATYYTYTNSTAYWWPIGSSKETSPDIFGGKPTSTTVTSEFTMSRTIMGVTRAHKGIDIGGSFGTTVIIATRGGTVTTVKDGCSSMGYYCSDCNGGYGNHVIIDHGDGTSSAYAHMYQGSITVKVGDTVEQGQKIGLMGSSGCSTGTHLHFEVRINGTQVNPLSYVDPANPRPVGATGDGVVVNGNSNIQTICLSLKASGFSNEATAAVLANIEAESSFRPNAVGDGGTSFGLCQWHNGRGNNMKSFCGASWDTDCGCQIKYLIKELQSSERSAYNALLAGGSAYDLGAAFCTKFERPANTAACYSVRGTNARDKYYPYVQNNCSN